MSSMNKLQQDVGATVVVSKEIKPPNKLRQPAVLVMAGVVLLLIAAGTLWYVRTHRSDASSTAVYTKDLPDDYAAMTPEQIGRKYQSQTGKTLDTIVDKHLTGRSFKNFADAYAAAQALNGLKKYDQSLTAYSIASSKATAKQADYQFYLRYAAVADLQKNGALYKQLQEKAKTAIQNDTTMSADRKKTELQTIATKQHLREMGY